jgi:RNA polymerase sigma-70 factor (ECF subfamily)
MNSNVESIIHNDSPHENARALDASASAANDKKLIMKSQNGDLDAFNQIVRKYEKTLYNFSKRLCGNDDDASDISQEAFVRAYSALRSFRGDSSFTTWILRIATNIYLDNRKKVMAHPTQSLDETIENDDGAMEKQLKGDSPDPFDIVEKNEKSNIIMQAVLELPEYQRSLILLYHNQSQSYEEIAAIMDLPIGTVKSRLNRARLALKDKLSRYLDL